MFPDDIPVTSRYYKIDTSNGWHEIPFGDNDGDSTITLTLTDGDPTTDGDGKQDGTISDPGAVAISPSTSSTPAVDSGGSSGCFIATAAYGSKWAPHVSLKLGIYVTTALMLFLSMGIIGLISFRRKKIKE
jgi:hypothetical protein